MIQTACKECQTVFDIPVTMAQINEWRSGTLIQKVMPDLSADLRELLISGICGKCFDEIFAGMDDDDYSDEGYPPDSLI